MYIRKPNTGLNKICTPSCIDNGKGHSEVAKWALNGLHTPLSCLLIGQKLVVKLYCSSHFFVHHLESLTSFHWHMNETTIPKSCATLRKSCISYKKKAIWHMWAKLLIDCLSNSQVMPAPRCIELASNDSPSKKCVNGEQMKRMSMHHQGQRPKYYWWNGCATTHCTLCSWYLDLKTLQPGVWVH